MPDYIFADRGIYPTWATSIIWLAQQQHDESGETLGYLCEQILQEIDKQVKIKLKEGV